MSQLTDTERNSRDYGDPSDGKSLSLHFCHLILIVFGAVYLLGLCTMWMIYPMVLTIISDPTIALLCALGVIGAFTTVALCVLGAVVLSLK